mgnify:CR=1 FL=1
MIVEPVMHTSVCWLGTALAFSMSKPQRSSTSVAFGVMVIAAPISFLNWDFREPERASPPDGAQ